MKSFVLLFLLLFIQTSYGEYYVEINGFEDGSSSRYYTADRNEVNIKKNTLAKVYGFKEVSPGIFDVHVQVLSGKHKGKSFLIRQEASRPTLSFYKKVQTQNKSYTPNTGEDRARVTQETKGLTTDGRNAATTAQLATLTNTINSSNNNITTNSTASSTCTNCYTERPQTVSLGGLFTPVLSNNRFSYLPLGNKKSPVKQVPLSCSSLVNPDSGEIGELGQHMVSLMSESPYKENFLSPHAMGKLCPRFESLTNKEKLSTWAWFWTALAAEESTCDSNVIHPKTVTKNGKTYKINPKVGWGLWAMEKNYNDRKWRGPECAKVTTPHEQARCSLSIMYKTQLAKGRSAYVPKGGYWGPIHRANRQLIHHMKRVTACF